MKPSCTNLDRLQFSPFQIAIACALCLCLCLTATSSAAQSIPGVTLRTVVIDPGHGGQDPGTVAPGGKIFEKRIVLSVALKFGKLIEKAYPDVNVLYTRSTDVFLPLATRSEFANKNHADLFISIHANGYTSASPSGSETHVMGMNNSESNMELIKSENSVIAYEEDYNTTYQGFDPYNPESYIIFSLLQNAHQEKSIQFAQMVQNALGRSPITVNRGVKQGGLLVLWRSAMPSVLVELGFLSNAKDRAVLTSEDGQQKLAAALFKAFQQYKTAYDKPYLTHQPTSDSATTSSTTSSAATSANSSGNAATTSSGNAATTSSGDTSTSTSAKASTTSSAATSTSTSANTSTATSANASTTSSAATSTSTSANTSTTTSANTSANTSTVFRVQILAVGKLLPANSREFKGYSGVRSKKVGNLYKYTIGAFTTKQEAQAYCNKVRKDFPGAFVVEDS